MKNRLLFILFLLVFSGHLLAQSPRLDNSEPAKKSSSAFFDRIVLGGSFSLQFGTQTVVGIAPQIGYKITDQLIAGIGLQYIYYHFKNSYSEYKSNVYGGSLFARYFLTENLFLHSEYEILNMDVPLDAYHYHRQDITSVFVGGGYRQMLGERSSIDLMILFNLNQSTYSPYENPIVRVGFSF